jgi:hypothetical protein
MSRLVDDVLEQVALNPGSIDIREHLPTLKEYASKCDHVTEFGVRWVISTWALIAGSPKTLESFDINHYKTWGVDEKILNEAATEAGVYFKFWQDDVLKTDKLVETDMLFIDTLHSYKQLKMELYLHAHKVKKYLVFHDIVSFGFMDEADVYDTGGWPEHLQNYYRELDDSKKGISPAIEEFLADNRREWEIDKKFENNNGLLILRRKSNA